MEMTCKACGTVSMVDDRPDAICPKCGRIFAKTAAPIAKPVPRDKPPATTFGKLLEQTLWVATAAGALLGALQVVLTSNDATTAPQQAAGMSMALAYAVVPYVLARAVQEFRR